MSAIKHGVLAMTFPFSSFSMRGHKIAFDFRCVFFSEQLLLILNRGKQQEISLETNTNVQTIEKNANVFGAMAHGSRHLFAKHHHHTIAHFYL